MSTIAIIDYGMGNLHSISKALQHVADSNIDIQITSNPQLINNADRIVFPGVGAIRDCMHALKTSGLDNVIKEIATQKPLLGICLGMQALLTDSEENNHVDCLNILPGHVISFAKPLIDHHNVLLKVPHMGWNQVQQMPHPLWKDIPQNSRFYFVHSYFAQPNNTQLIAAISEYPNSFACALMKENIFAVQFHPEKSQTVGLQLLKNFLNWDGQP
ncbi:MAG: imidazole glycerol phosphate synthase subunit HisH [Pseudomonadota bacterium]|jgi:glutamine amidotransferase